MWRRLVGRAHLDAGGDDSLILWTIATRDAICSGDLGSEFPRREHEDGPSRQCNGSTSDPAHGISKKKYHAKGRGGERYLSLTIGKAAAKATASRVRVGRSKARRVRRRVA
jgi:hypothetical protein